MSSWEDGLAVNQTSADKRVDLIADEGKPLLTSAARGVKASAGKRLSPVLLLLYCLPSLGFAASLNFMNLYQFNYFSNRYNVPLNNLNIAFLILQLVLFLSGPLIGWWSDTANTRFGRRRPFIALFGPMLMAICFLGMYPVAMSNVLDYTVWFGITYMLQNVVVLLFQSPYQALGIELTLSSEERNRLFGVTQTLYQLGIVISTALPSIVLFYHNSIREVYLWFAAIAAAFGALTMLILAASVKENADFVAEQRTPLIAGMVRTMQNRPFWSLLVSITCLNCQPYYLVLLPYWVQYTLGLDTFWQSIIMTAWMLGAFVCMPAWTWLSTRVGKKATYLLSMMCAVVTFSCTVFVGEGSKVSAFAVAFFCGSSGISLNANNFLFQSLLADVIEYDQLRTGFRREAQYTNIVQVFNALTSVMSVSLPLYLMNLAGFQSNVHNRALVRDTIALLIGPGAAAWVVLAALAFAFYPITTRVHADIVSGIAAHAAGQTAMDPLTKRMVHAPNAALNVVDERLAWFLDNFFTFELKLALAHGPKTLVWVMLGWLGFSLVGLTCSAMWIYANVSRYLEIGAFFAMVFVAWLVFTCARVLPAVRFARTPIPRQLLLHHVLHGNSLVD